MVDFLRMLHGQLVGLAVYSLVVIAIGVIVLLVVRKIMRGGTPFPLTYVIWAMVALIAIGAATVCIRAAKMASVNEVPRNVIDRSEVNAEADSFESRARESATAADSNQQKAKE